MRRSVTISRGWRVVSRPSALRKNRRAARLSRLALSRNSLVWLPPSDRPGQVAPAAIDPDVSPVDVPRPAARPQVAAQPSLELQREALDPAAEAGAVHLHAAVGEHAVEVAVAERELEGPAHRPVSVRAGGVRGGRSWCDHCALLGVGEDPAG